MGAGRNRYRLDRRFNLDYVSILARHGSRAQQPVPQDRLGATQFQSSPGMGAGRNHRLVRKSSIRRMFQSSPGMGAGRNLTPFNTHKVIT